MTGTNLFHRTPFAGPMADLPVACLDVGSRGGIEPDLLPVAFAVDAVGFEPAAAECERLNASDSGPWRSVRFIPAALAGKSGAAALHIAQNPASSSLLAPLRETADRFDKTAYSTIVGMAQVETCGLDEAVGRFGLPGFDFLKLDTEGTELDILRSGEAAVARALGVKVEVSFVTFREGQPPARDIDGFLAERGFELMALMAPSSWRVHGHATHPQLGGEAIPYSRGQLAHGDYLYLRHPARLGLEALDETGNAERRIRAAWIAMAYGYFDRAEEYLADPAVRRTFQSRWRLDPDPALRRASQVYGRAAWRGALGRQIRGLVPLLRQARKAIFQR